jgi:NTP pyrophosphatase (non-canonical NTP hydrolase)
MSENNVDLDKYLEFVSGLTSDASQDAAAFVARITELESGEHGVNVPLLITGYTGMAAEMGEFAEIPKKIIFQGKPLDEAAIYHMKRELGDIIWYWINSCRALGLNPNDVIQCNVDKLMARYPGGQFSVSHSETRKDGDI